MATNQVNILTFDNMNRIGLSTDSNEHIIELLERDATPRELPSPDETTDLAEKQRRRIALIREEERVKDPQKLLEAARQKPSLANKMYQLREQARNEFAPNNAGKRPEDQDKAELKVDENGNIFLKITKKMDGHPFDFAIHDGKVILPAGMSDDKLLEALDFLYRRGITNFELPPEQKGTNFEKLYEKVQKKREERTQTQPEEDSFNPFPIKYDPNKNKDKNGQKKSSDQMMDEWATLLGKIENRGYHKEAVWGGTVYSFYVDNNSEYYKEDGKIDVDKKKRRKDKEEGLLFRVKIQKDGSMGYYVPKNGKLPDNLADKLIGIAKNQGSSFVDLSNIPETDSGVFRAACARAGIVPRGISITERHVANTMLPEAEKVLPEEDLYKYKGNLGRYLLTLTKGNTTDRRYALATQLINQEKLYPVKQKLDGCLKDKLEERITGGQEGNPRAEEVIGAAKTVDQIATTIFKEPNITLAGLCDKLAKLGRENTDSNASENIEFKNDLKNALLLKMIERSDLQLTEDQRRNPIEALTLEQQEKLMAIRATKMDSDILLTIYDKLEAKNIKKAKDILIQKIRSNDKKAPDDVVAQEVNNAQRDLEKNLNKELTDKGFKDKFSIGSFGSPVFENADNYREQSRERNHLSQEQMRNRSLSIV